MSIICQKCRRLVRDANIHVHDGDYFCTKCQKSYKLPDSYYLRNALDIPKLQYKSDLKVKKTEDSLLIELPVHIFTIQFKIVSAVTLIPAFILLANYNDNKIKELLYVGLIFLVLFLFNLIKAFGKSSIEVIGDTISLHKKLFSMTHTQTEKLKDVKRIREIEVEIDGENGKEISSRFVEVYFNKFDSWELGHNLDKADRNYIIAALKLYHFYSYAE